MRAAAFLDDGNRAPHPAFRLEIPQHQHRIAQIADIERRLHRSHQAVLGQDQDRDDAELIEGAEQLVHLQDEKTLLRHRIHIAVQAVDDDDAMPSLLDTLANQVGKFAGRHLGRVDLLHPDLARIDMVLQRHAETRARANTVPSPSSKANTPTRSPRAAAAIA